MAGTALEDFNQSVAYKEIYGLGEQRGLRPGIEQGIEQGLQQGRKSAAAGGTRRGAAGFRRAADLEAWLAAA